MTRAELSRAYTDFYIDTHPDIFVIRNNPGAREYLYLVNKLPENIEPYRVETHDEVISWYSYQNKTQFGDMSTCFKWKKIEKNGTIDYVLDLN